MLFDQPIRFDSPLFLDVHAIAQKTLSQLHRSGQTQILHFDLHTWNVKWFRRRLAIFDFDDCAIGVPTQDLSTTVYYSRSRPDAAALEAALLEGYARVPQPPLPSGPEFETLLAAVRRASG